MYKNNANKRSMGHDLNEAYLGEEEFKKVKNSKDLISPRTEESSEVLNASQKHHMEKGMNIPYDHIMIVRGFTCYVFDPKTHEFTRMLDTLRDRSYFEMVNINKKVYAISTFSVVAAGTTEFYDTITHKWHVSTNLPRKLRSIGVTTTTSSDHHNILVTGGIDMDTLERSDEVYEAEVNDGGELEWKVKSKLLTPRFRHAAVRMSDGKILIAGGILNINGRDVFTATTEIYDPKKDVWKEGPTMKIQRAIDLHLLLVHDHPSNTTNTSTNTTPNKTKSKTTRASKTSTTASSPSSSIYAVGGDVMMPSYESEGGPILGSIEKFNESTNTWEFVTDFPSERRGIATCAIGHMIYIFGGRAGVTDLSTWDAFDTITRQWLSSSSSSVAVDKKDAGDGGSSSSGSLQMPVDMECLYGSACTIHVE